MHLLGKRKRIDADQSADVRSDGKSNRRADRNDAAHDERRPCGNDRSGHADRTCRIPVRGRDRRDSGLGTAFQRMLYDRALTDAQFLLNEVEDPDTAPDPAAKERMLRRIRHHARVGWQDTGVRVRTWGVDFRLMEYPLKILHDPETIRRLYWGIYRLSLSERQCREHIVFHTD